jgi:hypothetical protein
MSTALLELADTYCLTRGPLNKSAWDILKSRHIPPYHKATLFAYFFSYYGLATSWFSRSLPTFL